MRTLNSKDAGRKKQDIRKAIDKALDDVSKALEDSRWFEQVVLSAGRLSVLPKEKR